MIPDFEDKRNLLFIPRRRNDTPRSFPERFRCFRGESNGFCVNMIRRKCTFPPRICSCILSHKFSFVHKHLNWSLRTGWFFKILVVFTPFSITEKMGRNLKVCKICRRRGYTKSQSLKNIHSFLSLL